MWRVEEAAGFGVQYKMTGPALTWLNMQKEGQVKVLNDQNDGEV